MSTQDKPQFKRQRRYSNLLLKPSIQLKIGFYSITTALIFSALFTLLFYFHLGQFTELLIELTDMEEIVREELGHYLAQAFPSMLALGLVFFIANLVIAVLFTHKLVGPSYAFRRHIQHLMAGDYSSRVSLRKNDAFDEVAEDLNRLAEWMQEKEEPKAQGEEKPPKD